MSSRGTQRHTAPTRHPAAGWTLVELVVVMAIIVVIVGIVSTVVIQSQKSSRVTEASVMSQAEILDAASRITRDVSAGGTVLTADEQNMHLRRVNPITEKCEEVRYSVDGDALTVVTATFSGEECTGVATETPDTVVPTLSKKDVFSYEDTRGAQLDAPVTDIGSVALVKFTLEAHVKERVEPAKLSSAAAINKDSINTANPNKDPLGPPTLHVALGGVDTGRVWWDPLPGATGYILMRNGFDQVGNFVPPTPDTIPTSSATAWEDPNIPATKQTCYQVHGVNASGTGPPSQQVCTIAQAPLQVTPAEVCLTGTNTTRIDVSWTTVPGAIGYGVQHSLTNGATWDGPPGLTVGAGATSYSFTVPNGTKPILWMRTITPTGTGQWVEFTSGELQPCNDPGIVRATVPCDSNTLTYIMTKAGGPGSSITITRNGTPVATGLSTTLGTHTWTDTNPTPDAYVTPYRLSIVNETGVSDEVYARTCPVLPPACVDMRETDPPAVRFSIPNPLPYSQSVNVDYRLTRVRDGVQFHSGTRTNHTGTWTSPWIATGPLLPDRSGWNTDIRFETRASHIRPDMGGVREYGPWRANAPTGCTPVPPPPMCPVEVGVAGPFTFGIHPGADEMRRIGGGAVTYDPVVAVWAHADTRTNATSMRVAVVDGDGASSQPALNTNGTLTNANIGATVTPITGPAWNGSIWATKVTANDDSRIQAGTRTQLAVQYVNGRGVPSNWCLGTRDYTYPQMQTLDNDTLSYWPGKENSFYSVDSDMKQLTHTGTWVHLPVDKRNVTELTRIGQRDWAGNLRFPWWGQMSMSGADNQRVGVGLSRSSVGNQQQSDGEGERVPYQEEDRVEGTIDYYQGWIASGPGAGKDQSRQALTGNQAERTRYSLNWQFNDAWDYRQVGMSGEACLDNDTHPTALGIDYCTKSWTYAAVADLQRCLNNPAAGLTLGGNTGPLTRPECRQRAQNRLDDTRWTTQVRPTSMRAPTLASVQQVNNNHRLRVRVTDIRSEADSLALYTRNTNNVNLMTDYAFFDNNIKVKNLHSDSDCQLQQDNTYRCTWQINNSDGTNPFTPGTQAMIAPTTRWQYGSGVTKRSPMGNAIHRIIDNN